MELHDRVKQFESFRTATIEARELSERDIDYDDHHQWTADELNELDNRKQPPVVINRVKVKVNLLTGIQTKTRTVPLALPRTPQHEGGADAITEALRYIADNTNFKTKSSRCFREQVVPGYGGGITEIKNGEIHFTKIPWNRYYYDPHSKELDFADKTYDGIVIWMDAEIAKQKFPKKKADIDMMVSSSFTADETFEDKPTLWLDQHRKRIRVCEHYHLEDGVWRRSFFTNGLDLVDEEDSPYIDEEGRPQNPIEMQTAYIDRELRRYGEARSYIWLQDEINHRRSRLLYSGYTKQIVYEEGAVDDINVAKQELARADGAVKKNRGFELEILPNDAISEVSLLLYRESKAEIDELGANAALAGRSNARSGRQEQVQQQAGIAELSTLYDGHEDFENRVYKQMWNRAKQAWTAEKWIRITDDPDKLEWVGLNQPKTKGDILLEAAEKGDQRAIDMLEQTQGDPALLEQAEVRNNVAEIDVDIVITKSPEIATLRQETAEMMLALAERYGPEEVPFAAALEFTDVPNKKQIKKLLQPDPQQVAEQQELEKVLQSLEIADKESTIEERKAKTQGEIADAEAKQLETAIKREEYPDVVVSRKLEVRGKDLENKQKEVETIKLLTEPDPSVSVNT